MHNSLSEFDFFSLDIVSGRRGAPVLTALGSGSRALGRISGMPSPPTHASHCHTPLMEINEYHQAFGETYRNESDS